VCSEKIAIILANFAKKHNFLINKMLNEQYNKISVASHLNVTLILLVWP